jgi:hypothetical protein
MTTLIEAARQALEALETCMYPQQKQIQALTSLRQAIEQAEKQEALAWWVNSGHEGDVLFDEAEACRYALTINGSVTPFYTTPQPMREWVSLTLDEIWEVYKKHGSLQYKAFARAIEKALKEKNT